jgi:hypothetical protein
MNIINTTETLEQQKVRAVNVAIVRTNRDFKQMRDNWVREFNWFWHHPILTPQQMAEAWGNRGQALFESSGIFKQMLLAIDPNCLNGIESTPPLSFSFPGDGTVVIGE